MADLGIALIQSQEIIKLLKQAGVQSIIEQDNFFVKASVKI